MKARQIATAPYRGAKSLAQMVFRRGNGWNLFRLPGTRFDYLREVGDGTRSSTVVAPLEWIGRNFPAAVPTLWKQEAEGEEKQPDHPMLRLLSRPNPYYSGATNWAAVITDWFADGNGYMLVIEDLLGQPAELWWAPASTMTPKGTEEQFITHYEYRPNGIAIRVEPENVIHFRNGIDPDDPRKGRSPLRSVLREVFTDDEAANFTASLLKNMGVPGLVISPDGDYTMTPEEASAAKDHVQANFSGDKRGEPLVTSGKTKVQPFGFSPKDLSLKDLRRIPEERVTAVLGVPAIVAGLGAGLERSTFSNFSEAREAAYEECIIPTQRLIAEEIRFQLLPKFEADPYLCRFEFDTSGIRVLQEDKDKTSTRLGQQVKDGIITVAEARRELGRDADETDEVYLRPYSAIEVRQGEARPEPTTPKVRSNPHVPAKFKSRIAIGALISALERDADALTDLLAGKLAKSFDRLGSLAADAFESVTTEADFPTKAASGPIADQVLDQLKDNDWFESDVKAPIRAHYEETAAKTVDTINRVMDLGVMISDPGAQEVIAQGGTKLGMKDIEDETRDRIVSAIEQGRQEGQGAKEIARRIRDDVPKGRFVNAGSKYRAELIARAETKYAQNASTLTAYKESPNVTAVLCFDARIGEDHAPECEERAGKEFSFEDAENEDLTHPNCSLAWAPVVAESL